MVGSTDTRDAYAGDGSTLSFPITFDFYANTQVKVKTIAGDGVESELVEGSHFSLVGGNPAISVLMVTAPSGTEQLIIYRDTPQLQEADYITTGQFPAETHELVLDKIVMMIQEINYKVENVVPVATGAATQLGDQSVDDGDTITISNTNQTLVKKVQSADSGGNATSVIEDGGREWQRLSLIGLDDDRPLTLNSNGTNLKINRAMVLGLDKAIELLWDDTNTKWIELGRGE